MSSNNKSSIFVELPCLEKINSLLTSPGKLHKKLKQAVSLVYVTNLDDFIELDKDIIRKYIKTVQEKLLVAFETSKKIIAAWVHTHQIPEAENSKEKL